MNGAGRRLRFDGIVAGLQLIAVIGGCSEVSVVIGADAASPATVLPHPARLGPCSVTRGSDTLAPDNRALLLSIRVPAERTEPGIDNGACPPGPFPTVLIAPERQQQAEQYASYANFLATHGYTTIVVDYPNNDLILDHRELAKDLNALVDWVLDQSRTPEQLLFQRIDPNAFALIGHGSGATAGLLSAIEDPRIRAVGLLDPVDGNPLGGGVDARFPSVTPEMMPRVSQPLLLLGELGDATCGRPACQPCAPLADNYTRFYEAAVTPAVEITLRGGAHLSWLDEPRCGLPCDHCNVATADESQLRDLSRKYLVAFLQLTLRQRPAYGDYLIGSEIEADRANQLVEFRFKGMVLPSNDGGVDASADAGPTG